MAFITLLTDYGESDYYVAAVKAKILSINPVLRIVDITHQVPTCDIAHGAFVLKNVFQNFPKGTVHLVGIDEGGQTGDSFIALQLEGHYFVGVDNGFFGLLSDVQARYVVNINTLKPVETTFPGRRILAPAAARLASGTAITDLGPPVEQYKRMLPRQLKANKGLISGHVLRVDHYGNLITNIDRRTFDILWKNRPFTLNIGRDQTNRIHEQIHQVEAGDLFALFNDHGLLEIGINQGRADQLLGVSYDSPVLLKFEGE